MVKNQAGAVASKSASLEFVADVAPTGSVVVNGGNEDFFGGTVPVVIKRDLGGAFPVQWVDVVGVVQDNPPMESQWFASFPYDNDTAVSEIIVGLVLPVPMKVGSEIKLRFR